MKGHKSATPAGGSAAAADSSMENAIPGHLLGSTTVTAPVQPSFFAELTDLEDMMSKTDTAPRFECPRCQSKEQHVLKYQGEQYLQCSKCKYWSTKATLEHPEKGGFKRGN